MEKRSILIITLEPIAGKMAGPAIRSLEIGRQLANEFSVTVFSPHATTENSPPLIEANDQLKIVCGGGKTRLYALTEQADILFIQANVLKAFPTLTRSGKYLVVDLYDPYLFSLFEQYAEDEAHCFIELSAHASGSRETYGGSRFLCLRLRASARLLAGRYCALGKITPQMYKLDRSLRNLIDVVPFGVQDKPPSQTRHAIKGTVPGITPEDLVLLWGGGIWDWFDPLTIISAVDSLKNRLPNLRLYFMGSKSPNPQVPLMAMAKSARALSEELGLLNKFVFFSDQWVSYDDRANYLLDADIAVSAHFDVIETRYSFRTRILDYFWAGLPILTTGGDDLADLIESHGAGLSLPVQDQQAWADAIVKIAQDPQLKKRCQSASQMSAQRLHWSNVVEPLRQFCSEPYHLPTFTRVTMPSLIERAHAVYSRGGKELVIQRSKELFGDLLG